MAELRMSVLLCEDCGHDVRHHWPHCTYVGPYETCGCENKVAADASESYWGDENGMEREQGDKLREALSGYPRAMDEMDAWSWQTSEQTIRLAQELRTIRDTCPGVASNIAGRALREAGIEDPSDA